ncbi:DNA/RNA non-specific endonuclease [Limosilactobacillus kribbianus]|uniref:DNA/RNA non-specific endonuclease n=1 Tax=Limosilactobacillus kribbianus TaxID=2982695 RepID=UPI0022642A19|nr:DNA/RNA non-specific endonuclease [Limosilactobacillus kribbianus]
MNYQSGTNPVVQVNHGRSTLNPKSWRSNKVSYQQLDHLHRTASSNIAFLNWHNQANTNLRTRQTVQPTGWHANQDGNLIYNRGHLIAYSLTAGIDRNTGKYSSSPVGDQDNPRNLFTETDFTNQMLQTIYEARVRHTLIQGKHVVYQATPIFRGKELMARGINLQAIATDGSLNFNVYLYNVEPGIRFNYQNGSSANDSQIKIPVPVESLDESGDDNQRSLDNGSLRISDHYSRPIATAPRHYYRVWKTK